ncbi:transglycosylase domain-containing protein [Aliterella atlantica]|uniref:transglycosylase domain-containing protein n=1 Tax=Aliterella atlantica TaxID=1827278 RepID=UPI0005D2D345|nr:PBP1A family penicillin-binding protein [Aliterella atlantica]
MSKLLPWLKERTSKPSDSQPRVAKAQSEQGKESTQAKLSPPAKLWDGVQKLSSQLLAKLPNDKPLYRYKRFWLAVGVGGGAIAFTGIWWSIESSLPDAKELYTFVRDDTLTIKAGNGDILQQTGPATREPLKLTQVPKPLLQAFIASEDRRFYQHHGVDYHGIVRAFLSNIRSRNLVEGGSTITQQLSRILFLNQERTLWRKLKEVSLSQKIERTLSKEQILERYLNLVYLGSGAYGVGDASWVYYSKPVNKLTLAEMATIAGLAPAPSLYSPVVNPEAAKARRNLVLQRMQQDGVITPQAAKTAISAPIALKPSLPRRLQVQAPYFTTFIQQELPKYVSSEQLEAGGLTIETTLNPKWQSAAEAAVKNTVAQNGRWQGFQEASLVSIDPRTGEIKALVGGKDFYKNQFNRATQAKRQPGSTFKGFVYAAAIATGMSPYNSYIDAPFVIEGYEPKNYDRDYRGWMTMRDAFTASINTIAVKVLLDVGFNPTIKLARNMGIKSQLKPTYSLALGSNEVTLLELTSAYGTLATQGKHIEVHGIRRISDRSGKVIYTSKYKQKQVLDPGSAAIMTWMLKSVVQSGTGRAAQLNRPVAGKTGTSDKARDLWFVGYIPQVVTGVWLGNDNNRPTSGSSSTAAYTWHQFMAQAVDGMAVEEFPTRPKLVGRKGSIKAEPLKSKRIITKRIPRRRLGEGENAVLQAPDESNRRSRRNRYDRQETNEATPRRRRRYGANVQESQPSTRRIRRRRQPTDAPPPAAQAPQRQREQAPDNPVPQVKPTRSWRERLRPVERPRSNPPPAPAPAPDPTPGFGSDG